MAEIINTIEEKSTEPIEEIEEEIIEQTTFNEDSIEDLLEEGVVENVSEV